jgi:hypothetical protein
LYYIADILTLLNGLGFRSGIPERSAVIFFNWILKKVIVKVLGQFHAFLIQGSMKVIYLSFNLLKF